MNTVTKYINLNVSQPNNYQLIQAMQNDSDSIEVVATLYDGNQVYNIDDSVDVILFSGRTDSGALIENNVKSHTRNSVTFLLTKNMLCEEGNLRFCIKLCDSAGKTVLSTHEAVIHVHREPSGEFTQAELTAITDYVTEVKETCQEVNKTYQAIQETYQKVTDTYQNLISEKGQPNGIATLDKDGKLSLSQLPALKIPVDPAEEPEEIGSIWISTQ